MTPPMLAPPISADRRCAVCRPGPGLHAALKPGRRICRRARRARPGRHQCLAAHRARWRGDDHGAFGRDWPGRVHLGADADRRGTGMRLAAGTRRAAPTDPVYNNRMFKVQATARLDLGAGRSSRCAASVPARVMLVQAAAQSMGVPVAECQARGAVSPWRQQAQPGLWRSGDAGRGLAAPRAGHAQGARAMDLAGPADRPPGHPGQGQWHGAVRCRRAAARHVDRHRGGLSHVGQHACARGPGTGAGRGRCAPGGAPARCRGGAGRQLLDGAPGLAAPAARVAGTRRRAGRQRGTGRRLRQTRPVRPRWPSAWAMHRAGSAQPQGRRVDAQYAVPYLAHATMEPMNATVDVGPDSAEVWGPTQVSGEIAAHLAPLLGLPAQRITVHSTFVGGGFTTPRGVRCVRAGCAGLAGRAGARSS